MNKLKNCINYSSVRDDVYFHTLNKTNKMNHVHQYNQHYSAISVTLLVNYIKVTKLRGFASTDSS